MADISITAIPWDATGWLVLADQLEEEGLEIPANRSRYLSSVMEKVLKIPLTETPQLSRNRLYQWSSVNRAGFNNKIPPEKKDLFVALAPMAPWRGGTRIMNCYKEAAIRANQESFLVWLGLPSPDQKVVKKKVTTEWRREAKAAQYGQGKCVERKFKLSFLVFYDWQRTSNWKRPKDIAHYAAQIASWTITGSSISHNYLAQILWFKRVETLLITGEYQ